MFLDDKRRLLFASNYDGSLESYMDDFINKVAFGLNVVFTQRRGLPAHPLARARRRQGRAEVQGFLRRHQLPTDVWYKAYPGLTAVDLERNSRSASGLERPTMTDAEAREWLGLL